MADQHHPEDQRAQPGFGDRQIEGHAILSGRVRGKGLVQGLLGGGRLLIDKLATDLVITGQLANRLRPRQSLDG
jgi:hypothetical protein